MIAKQVWHVIADKPKVLGGQMDGATLYSRELNQHLRSGRTPVKPHTFEDLLRPGAAALFPDGARVLAAAGPYAYLYHYHREISGGDYPIVRDIHSGVWTGYLMQEWLCAPMTRPGDVVIFPSFYARDLFRAAFPEVAAKAKLFVSHPRFSGSDFPAWSPRNPNPGEIHIGCLGRLSQDKNLPDVLAAAALAQEKRPHQRVVLHLLGTPLDLGLEELRHIWSRFGGLQGNLKYWGYNLSSAKVREFFQTLDLMVFFSTSNVEALGRVVIEARNHQVPVCMARHAAVAELAPMEHTVPVTFDSEPFCCHNGVATGRIDPGAAVEAMAATLELRYKPPMEGHLFHAEPFCRVLAYEDWDQDGYDGLFGQAARPLFEVERPPCPSISEALALTDELITHFRYWQGLDRGPSKHQLAEKLRTLSSDQARSQAFLRNVEAGNMNYGDLSGYPFQVAQLAGFRPTAKAALAESFVLGSEGGVPCGPM